MKQKFTEFLNEKLRAPSLYKKKLPISALQKKDLLGLCTSYAIPECHHPYYDDIPCHGGPDRRPEPDYLESSEDSD